MSEAQIKKLSLCKEGDKVIIQKVNGSGAFKKRLLEMGFMKGVELSIIKYAPLKDPIELLIKGFHISLRVNEAAEIFVEI